MNEFYLKYTTNVSIFYHEMILFPPVKTFKYSTCLYLQQRNKTDD